MMTKLLLTPKEAAALLGTTPETLEALGVPFVSINGRGAGIRTHRRYSRPALLAWLAGSLPTPAVAQLARGAR